MQNPAKFFSLAGAVLLHGVLILLLVISFEKTINISAPMPSPSRPDKPIIDAVMINNDSLKAEVQRLESIERKKRQQEQARQQELIRQEQQAKLRRQKEEALAAELQKKTEELKKEAIRQELAQKKLEQERQAKLKEEQLQLAKIKKEKAAAVLAKKKIEDQQRKAVEQRAQDEQARREKAALEEARQKELAEQKAAETAAAQANARVKEDQISRHALLIRNKIHQYWRQPIGFDFTSMTCKLAVKLMPTGEVLDVTVIKSSGNLEYDRSAVLAVHKASPLTMPNDAYVAKEFNHFSFTFYPEGA